MVKITRVFASGKLGNLVFYEWKGKPVVRSQPDRIKQTAATVRESRLFGQAKKDFPGFAGGPGTPGG